MSQKNTQLSESEKAEIRAAALKNARAWLAKNSKLLPTKNGKA